MWYFLIIQLLLLLLLTGCGGNSYTYVSEQENPAGPGLLSGEDGVFSLYGTPPEQKSGDSAQEKID